MKFNPSIAYMKSPFVQVVQDGDLAVIWHSLFGYPKIISTETLDFIQLFSKPAMVQALLGVELSDENKKAIEELASCYFLVPEGFEDRAFLEKRMREREKEIAGGSLINYLGLVMSDACNFRCIYCIHFNNLEIADNVSSPEKFMRFEVAKEAVDRYIEILREHDKCVAEINFGGGEPLMAWPVVRQVLEYCCSVYGPEFDFHFSINTNAALITADIAWALKQYRVEIASSLDGLREGNDRVRLTKSGSGTFARIMRGFGRLAQVGYPLGGIAVTVNERNFHELDETIIDWAIVHSMKDVRIDIDVINTVGVSEDAIIAKLLHIRHYAKERGIDVPGFWSRPAENLNEPTIDTHVAFCGAARGNSICVKPSGDIYGCGYSTTQLGRLSEMRSFYAPEAAYHRFVREHLAGTMEMCRGCMIEGQCGGGCIITQEVARGVETEKIKRMCDFYRRMTREIIREQLQEAIA